MTANGVGVDTQGIVVKSGTTTNASLNNAGALVCKSVSCTTITTNNNAITCGSLNSASGLIKTTGSIESGYDPRDPI
jgi:hypothetical protein